MTTKEEIVSEISKKTNLGHKVVSDWIDMMVRAVPSKLAAGYSMTEAVSIANDEIRFMLTDLIEGRTDRARVARVYMTHLTYASANGLEYDSKTHGTPEEYAAKQTLIDPNLNSICETDTDRWVKWLSSKE